MAKAMAKAKAKARDVGGPPARPAIAKLGPGGDSIREQPRYARSTGTEAVQVGDSRRGSEFDDGVTPLPRGDHLATHPR